jgi:hypothetical protein
MCIIFKWVHVNLDHQSGPLFKIMVRKMFKPTSYQAINSNIW